MSNLEERIVLLLTESQITTTEIARRLNASRTTIIKYLKKMQEKGVISYRSVGPAKLWYIVQSEAGEQAKKMSQLFDQSFHKSLQNRKVSYLMD